MPYTNRQIHTLGNQGKDLDQGKTTEHYDNVTIENGRDDRERGRSLPECVRTAETNCRSHLSREKCGLPGHCYSVCGRFSWELQAQWPVRTKAECKAHIVIRDSETELMEVSVCVCTYTYTHKQSATSPGWCVLKRWDLNGLSAFTCLTCRWVPGENTAIGLLIF